MWLKDSFRTLFRCREPLDACFILKSKIEDSQILRLAPTPGSTFDAPGLKKTLRGTTLGLTGASYILEWNVACFWEHPEARPRPNFDASGLKKALPGTALGQLLTLLGSKRRFGAPPWGSPEQATFRNGM